VSRVRTRAGELAYEEVGAGSPVVLLHASLHDRHDFDAVLPVLARDHRVLSVDWPGHGESGPATGVTAPLLADALEDLVAALDLPPAVFVGNSVGGFAAARLAITHPERVAGLVLVNNGGFIPVGLATRAFCRVLGTPAVARRVMGPFIRGYMKAQGPDDRAVRDRALARARTAEGAATVAGLWRSFATPGHDLRGRAAELTAPTLLVWGSRDLALPMRAGRATHRALPAADLVALPTGHVVFASDPAGFLAHVLPFVERVAARSL
jgi:pimeloyl-ACP methyl ester carboxylesterase